MDSKGAESKRRTGSIGELEEDDELIVWTEVEVDGVRVYTSEDLPNPLLGLRMNKAS
jgi:hypothetical protein